ncbi:hypothetical protein AYI68_g1813 [Smittium mucronatum]|uniref:Uncharacterized protein n=1 Tax=Smittium mucronatum TaxID=133383 RepID=A0A1R0H4P8_9FUNG|nr:hypothetical protein AYI68_g1813 [Smittium mucronatum]
MSHREEPASQTLDCENITPSLVDSEQNSVGFQHTPSFESPTIPVAASLHKRSQSPHPQAFQYFQELSKKSENERIDPSMLNKTSFINIKNNSFASIKSKFSKNNDKFLTKIDDPTANWRAESIFEESLESKNLTKTPKTDEVNNVNSDKISTANKHQCGASSKFLIPANKNSDQSPISSKTPSLEANLSYSNKNIDISAPKNTSSSKNNLTENSESSSAYSETNNSPPVQFNTVNITYENKKVHNKIDSPLSKKKPIHVPTFKRLSNILTGRSPDSKKSAKIESNWSSKVSGLEPVKESNTLKSGRASEIVSSPSFELRRTATVGRSRALAPSRSHLKPLEQKSNNKNSFRVVNVQHVSPGNPTREEECYIPPTLENSEISSNNQQLNAKVRTINADPTQSIGPKESSIYNTPPNHTNRSNSNSVDSLIKNKKNHPSIDQISHSSLSISDPVVDCNDSFNLSLTRVPLDNVNLESSSEIIPLQNQSDFLSIASKIDSTTKVPNIENFLPKFNKSNPNPQFFVSDLNPLQSTRLSNTIVEASSSGNKTNGLADDINSIQDFSLKTTSLMHNAKNKPTSLLNADISSSECFSTSLIKKKPFEESIQNYDYIFPSQKDILKNFPLTGKRDDRNFTLDGPCLSDGLDEKEANPTYKLVSDSISDATVDEISDASPISKSLFGDTSISKKIKTDKNSSSNSYHTPSLDENLLNSLTPISKPLNFSRGHSFSSSKSEKIFFETTDPVSLIKYHSESPVKSSGFKNYIKESKVYTDIIKHDPQLDTSKKSLYIDPVQNNVSQLPSAKNHVVKTLITKNDRSEDGDMFTNNGNYSSHNVRDMKLKKALSQDDDQLLEKTKFSLKDSRSYQNVKVFKKLPDILPKSLKISNKYSSLEDADIKPDHLIQKIPSKELSNSDVPGKSSLEFLPYVDSRKENHQDVDDIICDQIVLSDDRIEEFRNDKSDQNNTANKHEKIPYPNKKDTLIQKKNYGSFVRKELLSVNNVQNKDLKKTIIIDSHSPQFSEDLSTPLSKSFLDKDTSKLETMKNPSPNKEFSVNNVPKSYSNKLNSSVTNSQSTNYENSLMQPHEKSYIVENPKIESQARKFLNPSIILDSSIKNNQKDTSSFGNLIESLVDEGVSSKEIESSQSVQSLFKDFGSEKSTENLKELQTIGPTVSHESIDDDLDPSAFRKPETILNQNLTEKMHLSKSHKSISTSSNLHGDQMTASKNGSSQPNENHQDIQIKENVDLGTEVQKSNFSNIDNLKKRSTKTYPIGILKKKSTENHFEEINKVYDEKKALLQANESNAGKEVAVNLGISNDIPNDPFTSINKGNTQINTEDDSAEKHNSLKPLSGNSINGDSEELDSDSNSDSLHSAEENHRPFSNPIKLIKKEKILKAIKNRMESAKSSAKDLYDNPEKIEGVLSRVQNINVPKFVSKPINKIKNSEFMQTGNIENINFDFLKLKPAKDGSKIKGLIDFFDNNFQLHSERFINYKKEDSIDEEKGGNASVGEGSDGDDDSNSDSNIPPRPDIVCYVRSRSLSSVKDSTLLEKDPKSCINHRPSSLSKSSRRSSSSGTMDSSHISVKSKRHSIDGSMNESESFISDKHLTSPFNETRFLAHKTKYNSENFDYHGTDGIRKDQQRRLKISRKINHRQKKKIEELQLLVTRLQTNKSLLESQIAVERARINLFLVNITKENIDLKKRAESLEREIKVVKSGFEGKIQDYQALLGKKDDQIFELEMRLEQYGF